MKRNLIIVGLIVFLGFEAYGATQVWNQKSNLPNTARHRSTGFSIGNKGYIGLGHFNSGVNGNTYLKDIWEYDPAADSWTQKADFGGGYRYHAVGFSYGNKGYIGTGQGSNASFGGAAYFTNDIWEFDPIANVWISKSPIPGPSRRGGVAFVINDFAFVGTGQIGSGVYSNDFYVYDIVNDIWASTVPNFPGSPRTSSVAFTINDKGYVGTGNAFGGTLDFYEYKMTSNSWVQRANVGTIARQEAFGFSVNGKGYIGTGDNFSSGTNFQDFWEYDPATDTWVEIQEFGGSARRYLDGFVIGNKAYCGLGTSGVNYKDLWEFDQLLSTVNRNKEYVQISNYPNPAHEYTIFELSNLPEGMMNQDVLLEVYNTQGQIIMSKYFDDPSLQLERSDLNNGFYVYRISYEGNTLKHGKFIFN